MKVVCITRSGATGPSARIAFRSSAACKPPKTLRPCIQLAGTRTDQVSPARAIDSRTSVKSIPSS